MNKIKCNCNELVSGVILQALTDYKMHYRSIKRKNENLVLLKKQASDEIDMEDDLEYKDYVLNHFDEMQSQYNMSPNNATSWIKKFGPYL